MMYIHARQAVSWQKVVAPNEAKGLKGPAKMH
jgi:hypothetical protein